MGAIRSDRPDRIVEVARDLFSRHGYSHVAYSDIARALNTSKAAIYYWYRAKQDMLAAAVAPLIHAVDELLDATQPRPPNQLLGELLDIHLGHRTEMTILLSDVAGVMTTQVGAVSKDQHDRLAAALVAGDPSLRAKARAEAALGIIRQAGVWNLCHILSHRLRPPMLAAASAALGSRPAA